MWNICFFHTSHLRHLRAPCEGMFESREAVLSTVRDHLN